MMYMTPRRFFYRLALLPALAGGLLALGAASAHAQNYDVSLDTTGLTAGHSYALDFQLNQGDVTPDSTVNVGNFLFGGGGSPDLTNVPQYSGIASGSLSSAVALGSSQASAYNEFTQNFNNGSGLGFTVNAAQLATQAGVRPDEFLFDLIDNSVLNPDGTTGALVATSDGSGQNALFTLTRAADGTYSAQNFGYTSGKTYKTTSAPSATPELGTVTSLGLLMGLFGLGALRARRGQARGAAGAE